jgi:hypothetical protein
VADIVQHTDGRDQPQRDLPGRLALKWRLRA